MGAEAIDALPYYDRDLDNVPGLRSSINQEIALELKGISLSDFSNVPSLPEPFTSSTLLQQAYKRVSNGQPTQPPTNGLDNARYGASLPTSYQDAGEWQDAYRTNAAMIEYQSQRAANVSLLQKFGGNSWRIENFLLEKEIERMEKQVEMTRERVESVNRERQSKQKTAGAQLTALENKWTNLIEGNTQLEIATLQLEYRVEQMKERERQLREQILAVEQ